MPASTDSQVTHKRIYRTSGNGGTLFYVGQIPNGQAVFNDANADSTLSLDYIRYENSPPPTYANDCCGPYNNSMFWTQGTNGIVYYSRVGYPEAMQGYVHVSSNNDPIQKLVIYGGELYAVTRYKIYQIYGENPYYVREFDGVTGTRCPDTVVATPKGLVWQSMDGIKIFTGGAQAMLIAGDALKPSFSHASVEGYSPFSGYINHACYARNEYLFGNNYRSVGIDLDTHRVRELGLAVNCIFYDEFADQVYAASNSRILNFEINQADPHDGSDDIQLNLKTTYREFEAPQRLSNVSIEVTSAGSSSNRYTVYLHIEEHYTEIGKIGGVIGRYVHDFLVDETCQSFAIEILGDVDVGLEIHKISVTHYPVVLEITGSDPVTIPGTMQGANNAITFTVEESRDEIPSRLYWYEYITFRAAGSKPFAVAYQKAGGNNYTISTGLSSLDDQFTEFKQLSFNGPLQRFYFRGSSVRALPAIYNLVVQRTAVDLVVSGMEQPLKIPGYLADAKAKVIWRNSVVNWQKPNPAYLYKRLSVIGRPNNITWHVFVDTLNGAATEVGSDNASIFSTYVYEVDQMGHLESVYIQGDFSDIAQNVTSLELVAQRITLLCRFGDTTFQVPGVIMDYNSGVMFDFTDVPEPALENTYLVERLIYDLRTSGNNMNFSIEFSGDVAEYTSGTINVAERAVGHTNIDKLGRIKRVRATFNSFNACALYKLELIASPVMLDVYLDGQLTQVPGYLQNISYLRWDLKTMQETTIQQCYLFERCLVDCNSVNNDVTPQITLIEGGNHNLSVFSSYARRVHDFEINRIGRLDAFNLIADWQYNIALYKIELVAHSVKLRLIVNGSVQEIPGRFRAYGQELFFEIYSALQESLTTTYVINRFHYDLNPSGQTFNCDLKIVGKDALEIFTTSSASRIISEVNLTQTGRPESFVIKSDFTTMDPVIYKLELDITATERRGV
jgi:hypothetical protein